MGSSPSGNRRFNELGERTGAEIRLLERQPFEKIGEVCVEEKLLIGLVLLDDDGDEEIDEEIDVYHKSEEINIARNIPSEKFTERVFLHYR